MSYRQFQDKKLLLGTQSSGKIREFETLLDPFGVAITSLKDNKIEDPEETGVTFLDNALLKAHYYAKAFNLPVLADDSGLCIEALDQKPGVYTKRFLAELGGGDVAFAKLESLLDGQSKKASMHCVLALAWPDGHTESFEGICEGSLVFPPRHLPSGETGFGVDPIFIPQGHDKTFSEDVAYKQKVSHRKQALDLLLNGCFS